MSNWQIAGGSIIPAGSSIRVALGYTAVPGFAPGGEELIRAVENNANLTVANIADDVTAMHMPFLSVSLWILGTTDADLSAGELIQQMYDSMADLEANRAVSGLSNITVGEVDIATSGGAGGIPLTTTVSLASLAILAVVGLVVVRQLRL